jgi:SAM-dependent methyltransferase
VSGFDPAWLALREPYDHAARSAELADRFAATVGEAPYLIDLACGTGSNLRYLAPRIASSQNWLCVDHDRALLDTARRALRDWGHDRGWPSHSEGDQLSLLRPGGEIRVRFALRDLAHAGLPAHRDVAGVSASALLDLTSAAWLVELAAWCHSAPVLMALSFNGRLLLEPAAPEDDAIRHAFIVHQRTDKGFGPALGPDAAAHLAERLAARGCRIALEPADWQLGRDDGALLRATLAGMVGAAREGARDPSLKRWATLRRRQLAAGDLRLTVGHIDLLALPG